MNTVIAVTSITEQRQVMRQLTENLKVLYHTDVAVSVAVTGMSRIDVFRTVNKVRHIAASYKVIIVPLSMSYEGLRGFSGSTNINISRVIRRLDELKQEITAFVMAERKSNTIARNNVELRRVLDRMFDKERLDEEC